MGSRVTLSKTSIAIGTMLVLLGIPYASPKLARLRVARAPWDRTPITEDLAETQKVTMPEPTQGEVKLEASKNEATVTNALPDKPAGSTEPPRTTTTSGTPTTEAPRPIDDPSGHALDAFYKRLAKTKAKEAGAVTRIEHYGDSVITSDYISGTLRRKLQATYGDAGHGFVLLAKGWDWYFHNDVVMGAGEGWTSSRITGPFNKDGMYGLGGVSFVGAPGTSSWYGTAGGTTYGKKVSRFDVYFEETPNGGEVELKAGEKSERFSTKGEEKKSAKHSFSVPDGEAKMTLKVVSGSPRLFGVALERDVPGVVYDALGANGGRGELLLGMDAGHWKEQMDLRDPALVILNYGTNESEGGIDSPVYEKKLRTLVDKAKAAAPNASVLIMAPLDRAEKSEGGALRTKPVIKKLVDAQQKVATEAQVGFWNTYEAMGGEGSMATWVRKGLAGSDLTHPSPSGGEMIGDLLYKALAAGLEKHEKPN